MKTVEPSPERLEAFLSGDDDAPIVMINLLRYREQAAYPEGFDAEPCSGRDNRPSLMALIVSINAEASRLVKSASGLSNIFPANASSRRAPSPGICRANWFK